MPRLLPLETTGSQSTPMLVQTSHCLPISKAFGYGLELNITKTYRNAQEVIDIAIGFIQKNTSQIKKALISPKHIANPVVIDTYTKRLTENNMRVKAESIS